MSVKTARQPTAEETGRTGFPIATGISTRPSFACWDEMYFGTGDAVLRTCHQVRPLRGGLARRPTDRRPAGRVRHSTMPHDHRLLTALCDRSARGPVRLGGRSRKTGTMRSLEHTAKTVSRGQRLPMNTTGRTRRELARERAECPWRQLCCPPLAGPCSADRTATRSHEEDSNRRSTAYSVAAPATNRCRRPLRVLARFVLQDRVQPALDAIEARIAPGRRQRSSCNALCPVGML